MNEVLFLMGCPRSGTTLLMDILASHKKMAWVSQYQNFIPYTTLPAYLNKLCSNNFIRKYMYLERGKRRKWLLPHPVEPWKFLNYHIKGFQTTRGGPTQPGNKRPYYNSQHETKNMKRKVQRIRKIQGCDYFLCKYTDFPRFRLISNVFPDAQFIHILRDPRAVVRSYYEKNVQGVFETWEERKWWSSGWPIEWKREWQGEYGGGKLAFFAYMWKFFLHKIFEESEEVNANNIVTVRYQQATDKPIKTVKGVLDKLSIHYDSDITKFVNNTNISSRNNKWKKLDDKSIQVIQSITNKDWERYKKRAVF